MPRWRRFPSLSSVLVTLADAQPEEWAWDWLSLIRQSGCTEARSKHPTLLRAVLRWKSGFLCSWLGSPSSSRRRWLRKLGKDFKVSSCQTGGAGGKTTKDSNFENVFYHFRIPPSFCFAIFRSASADLPKK